MKSPTSPEMFSVEAPRVHVISDPVASETLPASGVRLEPGRGGPPYSEVRVGVSEYVLHMHLEVPFVVHG